MARQLRPRLPGVPFHITARAQGKAPIFIGIESTVCGFIQNAVARSDAKLLAFAVMPNHVHLVLLQGKRPLHAFMQPLLRRVALLVQGRTGAEGHVFERRFHGSPCLDPEYFRNAIAYVHLNAQRAGLCSGPDYEWCTHGDYCRPSDNNVGPRPELEHVLRLFARDDRQTLRQCVADYKHFLQWRVLADSMIARGMIGGLGERPLTFGGDCHWLRTYGAAAAGIHPAARPQLRLDLRDLAQYTLADVAPEMPLDVLRSGGRSKALVRVRRVFIAKARCEGYAAGAIARFLQVSPTTVSAASQP